jgi:RNA 3'-terminal phosphate cyclase (ATP)
VIEVDGSMGEGGGQIVRTALALAMCSGTTVELRNIRARRRNPGLRAQHLAAVRAAIEICGARAAGAAIASQRLSFEPGPVRPGRYEVDVGTAGSTMLVLQTILPALSLCGSSSEVLLRGGTHNPRAPTFEFLRDSYLPLLGRLGFMAEIALERHGFFPRGGGIVRACIEPLRQRPALELLERGPVRARTADVLLARLPAHIGERELRVLRERLALAEGSCHATIVEAHGAGNAVHVRIDCSEITAVFAGFGSRGVPAETVAEHVANEVERYLAANVAVDAHLADQLLVPLALTAGGEFTTLPPSTHTQTNAAVIGEFIPVDYEQRELGPECWRITLRPRGPASAIDPPLPGHRR